VKAAIYVRVSTLDQNPDNQLIELRHYVGARGWQLVEYVDYGVSGAKESRPELNRLLRDAKKRQIDIVVCWRLDRLGRSLRHLIFLLEELSALGVGFISLGEGIDTSTPAGRLQLHVLGAIAEFERSRLRERVVAGLARARRDGKRLGRPPRLVTARDLAQVAGLSVRAAARELKVSPSVLQRARRDVAKAEMLMARRREPGASAAVP
jgi:DNA invertase Pin-like site-specific DNA recombinase